MTPARHPQLTKAAVPDTIFPAILLDDCYSRISPYFIPDTGYIIGSNIFGDLLQLQRVVHPSSSSFQITSAEFPFVLADSSAFDVYLRAVVFSEVDAEGTPTGFLGESDSMQVRDLNRDTTGGLINFTLFDFSEPVTVDNDSFLIGIEFFNAYTDSTIHFVGLYGTQVGCGDGNNLVQGFFTNEGLAFGTFAQFYGADLEIPVFVAVEDVTTSLRNTLTADYGTQAAPNPVSSQVRITFEAQVAGDYFVYLTDLTGRRLRKADYRLSSGKTRVEWQLGDLPSGIYVYYVDGPEGRQSGKLVKR